MTTIFRNAFLLLLNSALVASVFGADPLWNGYGRQSSGPQRSASTENAPVDPSTPRLYLLRTGFLMEGTAVTENNNYILKTDFGTIHVPVANVEYVGTDKLDIYRYKKSFIDGGNCNDLMKFAEWCFNLGLRKEGIDEYERALRVAPNATLSEVIRERLEAAQRQGAELTDELNPPLSGSAAPPKRRSESEVSRWAAEVPQSVVDNYVKKVQPILQAGCGAADCHGTNSQNKFKIGKPRQMLGATTYNNLRAVLPWINLDYPTESPLLTAMTSYHGGVKASYTVESKQYDNVLQWIQLAAKELPIEAHQAVAGKEKEPIKIEVANAKAEPTGPKTAEPEKGSLLPTGFHADTAKTEREETKKTPVDPLDPDVFNARYHGTKIR